MITKCLPSGFPGFFQKAPSLYQPESSHRFWVPHFQVFPGMWSLFSFLMKCVHLGAHMPIMPIILVNAPPTTLSLPQPPSLLPWRTSHNILNLVVHQNFSWIAFSLPEKGTDTVLPEAGAFSSWGRQGLASRSPSKTYCSACRLQVGCGRALQSTPLPRPSGCFWGPDGSGLGLCENKTVTVIHKKDYGVK